MPTVRRYGTRQVTPSPMPAARRTAAETAISQGAGVELARVGMFGAVAELGETVSRTGERLFAQQQAKRDDARRRADTLAVIEADNQLAAWERDRLYDPEQGALQVRGKDAQALPEQIDNEFDKRASEIAGTLSTDDQRVAFARIRGNRQESVGLTIRRHAEQEVRTWEASELKASVDNAVDTAITNAADPKRAGRELDRAEAAIRAVAPRLGAGPEAVAEQVSALQSRGVVGIIDRLLANDQVGKAQVYFEETKGLIAGDQLARVEKALEEGGLRQQAQKESDEIIRAGGTLTEWREQARGIEDPKLRDEVMTRVEHEAALRDRQDREADEARLKRAADIIDRTRDVTNIPPGEWAALSPSERSGLRSYARQLVEQSDVETDLPTYYRLMSQAADDPEAFARENLLTNVHKLGRVEFKQLADLQRSIRGADRKAADRDLAGFRTKDQIVTDTLAQYGIDPKGKGNEQAVAQLRRMLDLRIDAVQSEGVKVTNVEIQQALDDLLSAQKPGAKGSWWSFLPGGAPFFDQPGKRFIDLTVEDVPRDDRVQLERALKARGRPVSDATVLDLYLELMVRRQR